MPCSESATWPGSSVAVMPSAPRTSRAYLDRTDSAAHLGSEPSPGLLAIVVARSGLRRRRAGHPAAVLDGEQRPEVQPVHAALVEQHVGEEPDELVRRAERDEDVADQQQDDPAREDRRQEDPGPRDDGHEETDPQAEREKRRRQ